MSKKTENATDTVPSSPGEIVFEMVDNDEALMKAAERIAGQPVLGVDLEADSMHHFEEKICLIQMATASECMIVDPLKCSRMEILRPIFMDTGIKKIFHGADYDIRSLYRDFGIDVRNLFDTELASRFLGYAESGLDAMVTGKFGVSLSKAYQKKDWSQRPLPKQMLQYGAMDAMCLIPLASVLERELKEKDRLQWALEEAEILSNVRPTPAYRRPLFKQFKGAGRMDRRSLAVLEGLLSYRLEVAAGKDRPPFKVMRNESLKKIALAKPKTVKHLFELGALSKKQINMYGTRIVEEVRHAIEIPNADLPVYPKNRQPGLSYNASLRVKKLKEWRNEKARQLAIDPSLIISRLAIKSAAIQNPSSFDSLDSIEEMKNWQRKTFGNEIISVLQDQKRRAP